MNPTIEKLLDDLDRIRVMPDEQRKAAFDQINRLVEEVRDDVADFLCGVIERLPFQDEHQSTYVAMCLSALVTREFHHGSSGSQVARPNLPLDNISKLYKCLGQADPCRPRLLQWLAAVAGTRELETFADLTTSEPPIDETSAIVAFSPLFQQRDFDPTPLFPKMLDRLDTLSVAATILDLANHLTRKRHVASHPAGCRCNELIAMLGGLTERLASLEVENQPSAENPQELSRQIGESVAMVVSLCDALALIGDTSATGMLYEALKLSHRRIRTEAAGALAKLGERNGEDALLQLAAEPVARLRVIAYAEELGIEDKIADEFCNSVAVAEAELCLWLAQPMQFGIPPTKCELVEQRTLYWPSYEQPVDCFLIRFEYTFGDQSHSNIGISGPLTHAFKADLANLPPDDIFAIFAGWQAEHDEIWDMGVDRLNQQQRIEVARLERRLRDDQYSDVEPEIFGSFFGDKALVARARRHGKQGTAVVDAEDTTWFPKEMGDRSIGVTEAYCIYKGRALMRAFNQS